MLVGIRRAPDEQHFLDEVSQDGSIAHLEDASMMVSLSRELGEVPRHALAIVGDQRSVFSLTKPQYLWIVSSLTWRGWIGDVKNIHRAVLPEHSSHKLNGQVFINQEARRPSDAHARAPGAAAP